MFTQTALIALAALTPLVNAHGWMHRVVIDGTEYAGPTPNADPGQSAIRQVNSVEPVKGTDNNFLGCGQNAQPAPVVADANPGSEVGFGWVNGENGPWVHNTGPVLTYMASCGSGSCTQFDSTQAEWFKIDEKGRHDTDSNWFMSDYNSNRDALLSATIPTNLPAGEYLIRHELLALHNGQAEGGAEFYPACIQVRLSAPTRADAKLPTGSDIVTFPGGYSATDPGIWDQDVFTPSVPYQFPGPNVVSDAATGGDTNVDPTGSNAADPGTPTSSEAAVPTTTSGSGCGGSSSRKVKRVVKRVIRQAAKRSAAKQVQVQAQAAKRDVHRRTNSRVMRGLNLN